MGSFALLNATTWVGGHDFTTDLNELSVAISAEELEDTRFRAAGSGKGRTRIAGLRDVETELNGYWDSDADTSAFTGLGSTRQVVTHSPDGTEQSTAYTYQARKFSYQFGDEVGSVLPFTLTIMGAAGNASPGAVRGQVSAASQTVSGTGAFGTAVNLGAVGSDEFLYAALHVFTAGTTISLDIESDSTSGFGSPTTQQSFGPITTTGGTWVARVAGPITDTFYRFNATAVAGSFVVAGAIGIN